MNNININYYFNKAIEQNEVPKVKGKRTVSEIYDRRDEQEKENYHPAKRQAFQFSLVEVTENQSQSDDVIELTADQKNEVCYSEIEMLPFEVLYEIFRHLSGRDLIQVERTCTAFRNPCMILWKTRLRELIRINLDIESSYNVVGLRKRSLDLPKLTPGGEVDDYTITPHGITACKVVEYLCPLFEDYLHQMNSHPSPPKFYRGNLWKKDITDLKEEVQLCLGLRVIPSGMQHGLHYVKKGQHNHYALPSINVALLIEASPTILKALLTAGIPINNLDNYKNTLNAVLKRRDCREILPLFIDHGAKPCIGMNNNTLNYVIQHRELHDLLESLLDLGAAPSMSESKRTTDTLQSVINNGVEFTQKFLLITEKHREFHPEGEYFGFWMALLREYQKMCPA